VRRLIAALAVVALALGFNLVFIGAAQAAITSPAAGAVLRGQATLADTGGFDDSTLDHCSWFGGAGGSTRLQLINSGGGVVIDQFWNTGGAREYAFDTHGYANGAYTVRSVIEIRKNSGFLGLGCTTTSETATRPVTIDNITALSYTGATGAPQNTSATVSATLTDPNLAGLVLAGRTVTFALSGGTSVNATTNASGVATATLPISGPPRSATVTASFAATTFYKGSSASSPFAVTKNSTATTLTPPIPVVHGQTTGFTASVAATNGTGVPTGTIQFKVDGADFGSPVALSGGAASSQTTSALSTGNHTVTAVYNGDANFLASTSASATQAVGKAATTTALTAAPSPTVSGQSVTFTAVVGVVAPGVGVPTGGVQFNVDGQPAGTAVPLTGDTATLSISNLSTGNHTVTATYNGNADFAASSSADVTHGVNKAEAAVDLSTSEPNAVAGQPLTFTAAVTAVGPGAGTPTGAVQFAVDGDDLGGPVPLTGGVATSPVAHLDAGLHQVTANYEGDANFGGAQDSLNQDVDEAHTTTTVTSSPNPSVVGQPVTLRAEVTPVSPATGTPDGFVQFKVDGDAVGQFVELDNGVAELSTSTLAVGDHTIKATYLSSDINFITSTSTPITQSVNKAATSVDVVSSASPSVVGQPVTFTATVAVQAPGAGAPSGTVTFTDGSTVLDTVPVSSATAFQASFTTSTLTVAPHVITATYSGDASFTGSADDVIQKVNRAQTSTMVTSSANPAASGQGVTFTATVTPVAPGAGLPTGTVRFTVNGANLGAPATLVNGVATSTTFASLSPGTYAIKAAYNGDGNFVNSEGTLDQGNGQNVTKGATEMTLESSDETADFGQAVTFTSTVKAVAPATGRPSGVVQIWEGSVLLGASSLSPAASPHTSKAEFVTSTLTPGAHAIRAVYVGNFNFTGQVATTSQSVGSTATVTGVTSSKNPSTYGDDVTLTAVVTPTAVAPGVPTGTVTFTEGGDVLGTAPVSSVAGQRQASITLDTLSGGTHAIKATYSGDGVYAGSASAAYSQVVKRAETTLVANDVIELIGDNGGTVRAKLTSGGVGIAGQTLSFSTTQIIGTATNQICSGVTAADGEASCHNTNLMPAVIANGGFDVVFAGSNDYLPAEDHAQYAGGPTPPRN
jgi:uncharacterized protein (DUF2141 family)